MSIFDDIRLDAEATEVWRADQPDFANGWWVVFSSPDTHDGTVDRSGDGGFDERTARRIARTPQLERIALAANELAKAGDAALHLIEHMEGMGNSRQSVDLKAALAKFREATK